MTRVQKYLIPLVIVALSGFAMRAMAKRKQDPVKQKRPEAVAFVEVKQFTPSTEPLRIDANGTVEPYQSVSLIPQVSGKVTSLSPKMRTGEVVKRGETLVQVDRRDYQLRLDQVKSAHEQAKIKLLMEQEEEALAQEQWADYQAGNPDAQAGALTLREPQRKQAEAAVKSAQAQVGSAKLSLSRTRISAPFNGVVVQKKCEVGQVIGASPVATLYGTDAALVMLALSEEDFYLAGVSRGDSVAITADLGGTPQHWRGAVQAVDPVIDPLSRMVKVQVIVADPLTQNSAAALAFGQFVRASFEAAVEGDLYRLPRKAVSESNTVRLMVNGTLALRAVELLRWEGDDAVITGGITPEDAVVVSDLAVTLEGMALTTEKRTPTPESGKGKKGRKGSKK